MKLGRLGDERLGLVTDAGFVDLEGVFKPVRDVPTQIQWCSLSSAGTS